MAYVLPANSIAELSLEYLCDGQRCLSLFHYRINAEQADGEASLREMLQDWTDNGALYEAIQAGTSEHLQLTTAYIQSIYSPPPFVVRRPRYQYNLMEFGAVVGDMMPSCLSASITKRTEQAGRSGLGTLAIPGLPVSYNENGYLSAGGKAAMDAIAVQMDTDASPTSGTATPVIYRRTDPANSPVITGATAQNTLRTQKRRVVGRGI